jgi:hypothetical protein
VLVANEPVKNSDTCALRSSLDQRVVVEAEDLDAGAGTLSQTSDKLNVQIERRGERLEVFSNGCRHQMSVRALNGLPVVQQVKGLFDSCGSVVEFGLDFTASGRICDPILDSIPKLRRQWVAIPVQKGGAGPEQVADALRPELPGYASLKRCCEIECCDHVSLRLTLSINGGAQRRPLHAVVKWFHVPPTPSHTLP